MAQPMAQRCEQCWVALRRPATPPCSAGPSMPNQSAASHGTRNGLPLLGVTEPLRHPEVGPASCGAPRRFIHFVDDDGVTQLLSCQLHGPLCPKVVPLDGGMAATRAQRVVEILVPPVGACHNCLPHRQPASFEVWRTLADDELEEGEARHTIRLELCTACTIHGHADSSATIARVRALA